MSSARMRAPMAPHDNDRECERRAGRHAAGSRAPRVRLRRLPAVQAFKLGHYRPGGSVLIWRLRRPPILNAPSRVLDPVGVVEGLPHCLADVGATGQSTFVGAVLVQNLVLPVPLVGDESAYDEPASKQGYGSRRQAHIRRTICESQRRLT